MSTPSLGLIEYNAIIDRYNFKPIENRLVNTEKWSANEAAKVVNQYRNYLYLRLKYREAILPPSKEIDEAWHAHILHTKQYREFCDELFNEYLDHAPQSPDDIADRSSTEIYFEQTQMLYKKEFGTYIYQITGKSWLTKIRESIAKLLLKQFPKLEEIIEK